MRSRRSGTVARQTSPIHESRPVTSGSSTSTRETFSISSVHESPPATPPIVPVHDDQPRPVTPALTRESTYSSNSVPRRVTSSISSIREARPGGPLTPSIVSNREPRRVSSSVSSIREERSDGRVGVTSSGSISSIHEGLLQHQATTSMDPPANHSPSSSTTHYFTVSSVTTKPPNLEVVEAVEAKRAFETEPEATRGSVTEDRAPIGPSPLTQDSFAVGPAKTFSEPAEISRPASPSFSVTRRSTVRGERKTDEERRLEAEKRERKLDMEARERRSEELEGKRKLSVEEWGRRIKGEERELRLSLEEAKRKLELKREHRAGVEWAGNAPSAVERGMIEAEERELELSVEEAVRKLEESIRERRARDEDERKVGGRKTEEAARESITENHTSISPWVQGISTGDAILSTPVGEYTPPVSKSSTAAEPQASNNEPDGQSHLAMIMDPLRSSSTPIPRGFALQENLSTELLAQVPLQAEVPAPEHQVVPQVIVPNNADASDRSRASSIHVPPDEGDGNIIMPIPVNVGHPRSIQEAASARSIRGFDTGETPPPLPRSGSLENSSPSGGIHMDLGMLPSRLQYPPGQGRRRVLASPQEPERGEIGSGDGRAQVGWIVPFSADSRQSNAYQQDFRESPNGVYNATRNLETREASPHISPPSPSSTSSGYDLHLQSSANPHHATPSFTRPPPPQENRRFHAHGWAEYLLPDESLYYVHQGYQVVADMDLNDEKLLDAIMAYLDGHCDVTPGQELWLREMAPREGGFDPLRWLVDHSKQSVAFNPLHQANGDGEGHRPQYGCGDDRLDARYRYWSFMESHPAHTSLPLGAHQEAMNSLNWASTNGLLPRNHSAPAPFTPEECQSLTALLRSAEKQGETPFRTNTVSKILLRAICRRQSHSRPDKPLPADAGHGGLHRAGHSTPVNSSALVLMATVYACLATVVALCLLSQSFMKTMGVGAILLFLSLAVSNIVAVVQSEADNGPIAPHVRRAILMFSRKDHAVADLGPPTSLPWYILLWRGLESRLYRTLIPRPPDAIRATAAKSM